MLSLLKGNSVSILFGFIVSHNMRAHDAFTDNDYSNNVTIVTFSCTHCTGINADGENVSDLVS
jgi:hypothetical protein